MIDVKNLFKNTNLKNNLRNISFKNEILSGLTVALALIPEAVAFAFVAGVGPLVGLYAAFIVGLITSLFGGRPGMVSGATGALAVVIVALVAEHGIEYLFATVVLMGILQIAAGRLKLGKYVRLIPHSVLLGFVNGLAIVIFISQLAHFKFLENGVMQWMTGIPLYIMLGLVGTTMAIIHFLPKFTKAIPASLAAILAITLAVRFIGIDTHVVHDIASISGGFPQFHIPMVPINLETLKIITPYAFIMAAVGLIESLLTLSLVDEVTRTRGCANKECVGQGLANVVTGFFGGMGGCAMIGQSMINVNSGGKTRVSSFAASLFLLISILFAAPLIEMIPLAALIGVMFMVVIGTFEWSSLRIFKKIPKTDALVLIAVSIVTVLTNLAIAVLIGIIISALAFAWQKGRQISVTVEKSKGKKKYILDGALFFGSVRNFLDIFDVDKDPKVVSIDFMNSRIHDHSAMEALNKLTESYLEKGKELHILNVSPECMQLLKNAGSIFEISVIKDLDWYHIAVDDLPKKSSVKKITKKKVVKKKTVKKKK